MPKDHPQSHETDSRDQIEGVAVPHDGVRVPRSNERIIPVVRQSTLGWEITKDPDAPLEPASQNGWEITKDDRRGEWPEQPDNPLEN